jgi:alginate O-acetyltransferase complex protein AlgI
MSFNSVEFALFLPIVFILYWFAFHRTARQQNLMLLFASLAFYAFADWRMLGLLLFSGVFNYLLGIQLGKGSDNAKRIWLYIGLVVNIGLLGYFKYFNFFYNSFVDFFGVFGMHLPYSVLKVLLPLGLSFYTFQLIGYLVDVHNEDMEPCDDPLLFFTFLFYFPKMLAGPIEPAQSFFKQARQTRLFDYALAVDGMRQILWGLFAKLVIADNIARFINPDFKNFGSTEGSMMFIETCLYIIQVYCDFAGYSNVAIGVSKLFGIRLMPNFAAPFYSTNIAQFWKKWHISLSGWMMQYVFAPMSFAFRRKGKIGLAISITFTFLVVGLWHGANWTFILFGVLQGIYFLPLVFAGTMNAPAIVAPGKMWPTFNDTWRMGAMCVLLALTGVFFRADTVTNALRYLANIFSPSLLSIPHLPAASGGNMWFAVTMLLLVLFMLAEWFQREREHELQVERVKSVVVRWGLYAVLLTLILNCRAVQQSFIYFQF